MPDIAFVPPELPRSGALVLPVPEGDAAPAGLHAELDRLTGGAIGRALLAAGFKGKRGQSCTLFAPTLADGAAGPNRVVAVGLGRDPDALALEAAGGATAGLIAAEREAMVDAAALPGDGAAHLALGLALRSHRFDRYRTTLTEEDRPKLERVALAVADPDAARRAWMPRAGLVGGVTLARDLVAEPPNVLGPEELAERCRALEPLGVEVEIIGHKELKRLGFGALLATAQGSARDPRVVVLRWAGAPSPDGPVALLGKGVTFDSGGISIKPGGGMEDMKFDMAGAAAVIGGLHALATRRAACDVVGLIGLIENMPSGTAQRPGDVVRSLSGLTVEVINTDAEGRLVLADLLHYAGERFRPRAIVDVATLTGACVVALGHEHAGLFANDDALAQAIAAAGRDVGEACWRLPLGEGYDKLLKSDVADLKNVGGRPGGASIAACFLGRFVPQRNGQPTPWAHLDIAGTAWTTKDLATVPKGASGWGVRLLDRLVAARFEG